jgi:uncharacterized coiled-coil protein SlyX
MMTEDRLNRIEQKLDKLSEAVVSLARMEERMVTLFNKMDKYDQAQQKVADRVTELEKKLATKANTVRLGEKLFWICCGGVVSFLVWAARFSV